MSKVGVFEVQAPLRAKYKSSPAAALVTDHARTTGADSGDPFHLVGSGKTARGRRALLCRAADVAKPAHRADYVPHVTQ